VDPDPDSDPAADPDPSVFIIDLQDANKKQIFFKKFSCILLFEGTFTSFSKDRHHADMAMVHKILCGRGGA
jgi:hypothetical protein